MTKAPEEKVSQADRQKADRRGLLSSLFQVTLVELFVVVMAFIVLAFLLRN